MKTNASFPHRSSFLEERERAEVQKQKPCKSFHSRLVCVEGQRQPETFRNRELVDEVPRPSGDRVRKRENVVLGGSTGDVCYDRVQAQSFLKSFVNALWGALAGDLSYLHNRIHVWHGVEIVGSEFGFSSSLDLPPGFDDFFSNPSLDLWIFRELVQTPRDLFWLAVSTNGNGPLCLR